jgi:hypothetical protein
VGKQEEWTGLIGADVEAWIGFGLDKANFMQGVCEGFVPELGLCFKL